MKLPCSRCMKVLVDGSAICTSCDGSPRCGHHVLLGLPCASCGTRELYISTPPPRHPDIELQEHTPTVVGECGNCARPILVSAAGWKRCGCGSETTVLS